MHLTDDQIRAYADGELPSDAALQAAGHLERCPDCRARSDRLAAAARIAMARIDSLSPTRREGPRPAPEAYAQFRAGRMNPSETKVREIPMLRRKAFWAALAVLTALALVFTMTPARAWASTFLNLFRVQKVQVITFDPAAAEDLHDQMRANQELFEQVFQEDLEVTERGEERPVSSITEAAEIVGFTPRLPLALENANVMVQPGVDAVITIDQPKFQELLDLAGVDYQIPAELHGQVATVEVPDAVVLTSGCPQVEPDMDREDPLDGCLTFAQMRSPEVNAPEALDVPRMGQAVFQLLGYSPADAEALSRRIDWTSTLVLPIPTDEGIATREVQVDGVTGTMLAEDGAAMLIWVNDGMLYALRSPQGAEHALAIARSLQ